MIANTIKELILRFLNEVCIGSAYIPTAIKTNSASENASVVAVCHFQNPSIPLV